MSRILSHSIDVSPRRWMFIPLGIKVRELDGSACLAFEAAERGWGVILANKSLLKDREDLPRGLHLEKKITKGAGKKIKEIRSIGHKVIAWCEEGLVYPNAKEYGSRKIEKEAFDQLEVFFTWGQNQANDLMKIGCGGDKLAVTGNPRFDLHRSDMRGIYDDKVERIKKKYAPFILVNTRFSYRNGLRSSSESFAKMSKKGRVKTREQELELKDLIAFHGAGFEKFMEMVELLSLGFPDNTIVIRPHPSERKETWIKKAASLPHVKVNCEGNVIEWLLASEISIHNNCTTGVESYLLGKTSISYRPVCDPRFDLFLPNALSTNAYEADQLIDLVQKTLRGEKLAAIKNDTEKADLAGHYIANVDGKRASERILDVLETMDLPMQPFSFSAGPLHNFRIAAKRNFRKLKGDNPGGNHLIQTCATRQGMIQLKRKVPLRHSVNKLELLELLRATQKVTGRFSRLQINELENHVFCIH